MPTKPSDIAAQLVTTIEAIDLTGRMASPRDVFRGRVGIDPPAGNGDRLFSVMAAGSQRSQLLCQNQYDVDLDVSVYYRFADGRSDLFTRIMDDQHEITKAVMTSGGFHGATNPAIIDVVISDPTPPAEVGEGLIVSSRTVSVRFDDTLSVGV